MKQPNERAILMDQESVEGILSGRKTETRRLMTPQPVLIFSTREGLQAHYGTSAGELEAQAVPPPYQVGDRLWVKETTARSQPGEPILYRAGSNINTPVTWRPSLFMTKEMARIWLEVTEVGAERLSDITTEAAIREGWDPEDGRTPVQWYRERWNDLYGSAGAIAKLQKGWRKAGVITVYPWNALDVPTGPPPLYGGKPVEYVANPFVWAYRYRILTTTREQIF